MRSLRHFNPRSPCGERRECKKLCVINRIISIHAPRAGSDFLLSCTAWPFSNFNPRSPCGERPTRGSRKRSAAKFQSTLPVRGATTHTIKLAHGAKFQSTLPVRGATQARARLWTLSKNFNPRSPCGERRHIISIYTIARRISIHAPRAGSD